MSRVGKKQIAIPTGVQIKTVDTVVEVSGPKGTLKKDMFGRVQLRFSENKLNVESVKCENASAYWGLYRTLLSNMITGVSNGYSKSLEIQGTGYRASLEGKNLNLTVGFSHPVKLSPPEGVTFEVDKSGKVTVSGIDKELVGQTAAKIRRVRPAEPYQGKGIRYAGEVIKTKVGKSATKK